MGLVVFGAYVLTIVFWWLLGFALLGWWFCGLIGFVLALLFVLAGGHLVVVLVFVVGYCCLV